MTTPDDILARRCRKGEGAAFAEMVARHYKRVWNLAFQMTGDADDADDVAQDVFVRVCRSIGGFQRRSHLSTWLYRITVNLCIDLSRRSRRREAVSLDQSVWEDRRSGAVEPVASGHPAGTHNPSGSPLREIEAAELRAKLKEAMLALPERYRTVIVLRDIECLSYREIAAVLRCPEGTVMSRLFYGKKALREQLRLYLDG